MIHFNLSAPLPTQSLPPGRILMRPEERGTKESAFVNSLLNIIAFGEPQAKSQEWPRGVRPP